MTRRAAAAERVLVLVTGLLLVAAGAAAVAWREEWFPELIGGPMDTSAVAERTDDAWWPWALCGAGVLLILLGLWWWRVHLRRDTERQLRLAGSGRGGRLTADTGAIMDSAAAALDAVPGLTYRQGRLRRERGGHVVEVKAAADPGAQLADAAVAAERAAVAVRAHLGTEATAGFRLLVVAARRRTQPTRVR